MIHQKAAMNIGEESFAAKALVSTTMDKLSDFEKKKEALKEKATIDVKASKESIIDGQTEVEETSGKNIEITDPEEKLSSVPSGETFQSSTMTTIPILRSVKERTQDFYETDKGTIEVSAENVLAKEDIVVPISSTTNVQVDILNKRQVLDTC